MRPLLLDLFCCQGGASRGYVDAGFDVLGIDNVPQPRYPFDFNVCDAVELMKQLLNRRDHPVLGYGLMDIDAIHASPPCQAHTNAQRIQGNSHPDLIEPIRHLLKVSGKPYVIENVPGAPLIEPVELCGAMFGLETYRHRLFETNWGLTAPDHPEHMARTTKMGRPPREGEFMHIVGNFSGVDRGRRVMGMPWANRDGLREAIPPAYTEYIGSQLMERITSASLVK